MTIKFDADDSESSNPWTSPVPSAASPVNIFNDPPPYESLVPAESSAATPPGEHREPPAGVLHLFSRPEQAERKLSNSEPRTGIDCTAGFLGTKVAHDAKLNNAEFLHNFIRERALLPPTFKLRCKGTHKETQRRSETHTHNGKVKTRHFTEEVDVTDFDFTIDLTKYLPSTDTNTPNLINLTTVLPTEPAYRGTQDQTFHPSIPSPKPTRSRDRPVQLSLTEGAELATSAGRKANRRERKLWSKWREFRNFKGWPIWWPFSEDFLENFESKKKGKGKSRVKAKLGMYANAPVGAEDAARAFEAANEEERGLVANDTVLSDDRPVEVASLMQWCTAYAKSKKPLKEFVLNKEIWGWDLEGLTIAIQALIASTGYRHQVQVKFETTDSKIVVKPDNPLSRMTSKLWVVVILWITLIYPFVLLYKKIQGGAKWEIVTASYPMKVYLPADLSLPIHVGDPTIRHGPASDGSLLYKMYGKRESDFMKDWEDKIKFGVIHKITGDLSGDVMPQTSVRNWDY